MKHSHRIILFFCAVFLLQTPCCFAAGPPDLWLKYSTNLLPEQNIDRLQQIWARAAAAGYTHVLLSDSKFARLDELGDNQKIYLAHVRQAKQIAARLKLQIIPALFDIGYSNDLLSHDANLAEGLPVRDQLFIVHNGQTEPVADPAVVLAEPSWKDDAFQIHSGIGALSAFHGNARLCWTLKVQPFHCYHVSCRLKSDHFSGKPQIEALAKGQNLQYQNVLFAPTQDWTRCDVVFNSLSNSTVNLYIGVWGDAAGKLWIKDWHIDEAGLVNVLRRPGTPCTVRDDRTNTQYIEGRDYDPIVDPHLGNNPWAGEYTSWHEPPIVRTRLPEGTRLRISWYHPAIIYDDQVSICFESPAARQLLANQAKLMKQTWGAPGYMMSHDEIRVMGWDQSCLVHHETPGRMLADNLQYCTGLLAGSQAYVWSDMFDPFHNAVNQYYLVNGSLAGAWNGLSPDVIVINWNYGHRDESLKFFEGRGNRQIIAAYYDAPLSQLHDWFTSTAKVQGIIGFMYTTWRDDYSNLEAFAQVVRH